MRKYRHTDTREVCVLLTESKRNACFTEPLRLLYEAGACFIALCQSRSLTDWIIHLHVALQADGGRNRFVDQLIDGLRIKNKH